MNLSLFSIAAEYRADCEKLCDLDLDEATLRDTLEGMSGELEVKARNVAIVATARKLVTIAFLIWTVVAAATTLGYAHPASS